MPKPTFKECLKKKGFLSKIDLLFRYYTSELFLLILVIIFSLTTIYYNVAIKDKIIYPNREFEYLESVAYDNSNKIYEIIQNPEIINDYEYEINITQDIIKTKYTIPVSVGSILVESVSVTVKQEPSSLEIISINREIGEKGFYNLMFIDYVVLFSMLITIGVGFVIMIICIFREIIKSSKIKKQKKNRITG